MGRAKALLPLGASETFLSRIVRAFQAAGVCDIVVVLGYEAGAIAENLKAAGLDVRVVINESYEAGQFSSLLKGLNAVDRPGVDAMLLTLVDVPLVSPDSIRALVRRYQEHAVPIVRLVRGAEHGHPVMIDRSLFPVLRAAHPSSGAKPVVRAHASSLGDVSVDDDGAFLDIDTPEEYARVLSKAETL